MLPDEDGGMKVKMQRSHHVCMMLALKAKREKGKVGGSRRSVSHSSLTRRTPS